VLARGRERPFSPEEGGGPNPSPQGKVVLAFVRAGRIFGITVARPAVRHRIHPMQGTTKLQVVGTAQLCVCVWRACSVGLCACLLLPPMGGSVWGPCWFVSGPGLAWTPGCGAGGPAGSVHPQGGRHHTSRARPPTQAASDQHESLLRLLFPPLAVAMALQQLTVVDLLKVRASKGSQSKLADKAARKLPKGRKIQHHPARVHAVPVLWQLASMFCPKLAFPSVDTQALDVMTMPLACSRLPLAERPLGAGFSSRLGVERVAGGRRGACLGIPPARINIRGQSVLPEAKERRRGGGRAPSRQPNSGAG
jgi:hypothetical protein